MLARNLLCVSIIKAFIKSCSNDSRNEQSPTCEIVHESSLSEISFPTDSLLAQLAERETDDLEVVGSIPSRGKFLFCSSLSMLAGSCHDLGGIIDKLECKMGQNNLTHTNTNA